MTCCLPAGLEAATALALVEPLRGSRALKVSAPFQCSRSERPRGKPPRGLEGGEAEEGALKESE
jgi:hypothetical protein